MIVLSYAPDDTHRIERFYRAFQEAGLEPWMDSKDRPQGALWEAALSLAVRRCDLLVVFISQHSIDKYGLMHKELLHALSNWDKKESDDVHVITVRLESCKIPDQIARFQKFDALDETKTSQLVILLRVLHGKATGKFDFLPERIEYRLTQISSEKPTHCDIGVTIPEFHMADGEKLASVNSLIEGTARNILEVFLAHAVPMLSPEENSESELEELRDGFWLQPTVLTGTHSLISLEFYISTRISGEARRQYYTKTLNIDVENSSELFLKDLVTNQDMAMNFFSRYCENALTAESEFRLAAKDWKFDSSGVSPFQSFGFRNADLIFIFAPRPIGEHAFGRKRVELPFNDVYRFLTNRTIDLLVDQYKPAVCTETRKDSE